MKPSEQDWRHTPASQTPAAFGPDRHTCPHPPQLFASNIVSASQPSLGSPLQSKNPGLHSATTHCPLRHAEVAFGSGGQSGPLDLASSISPSQSSSRPLQ